MKYAINPRGRKIRVEDRDLQDLIQKGFIEITEEEFNKKEYIGQLDQGTKVENKLVQQIQNQNNKERSSFRTRIV